MLNLPVFDTTNVNVWFAQLEAIFQAKKIQSQMVRYAYVVEKLPPEIASDVLDLLNNVPIHNPFDTLKEAIIYRTGKSQERKLNDLFNTLQLGDSKPSQLLRKMKNLLGKNSMSDSLFRKLWMDKLPTHTTQILATLPEDLDLEKTAEIADKISDAATISSVNAPTLRDTPREDEFNKLQQQINRLSEQIDRLYRERLSSAHNLYKSQRRSRSNSRGRNDVYCWYHRKFGQAACNFKQQPNSTSCQKAGNTIPNSA
ncbi:unnamed protein product [Acanthosepion pharaonis]|uniref:DUF7041 domain-containing protein n=1 Tax=Acanthosepion pharaonis TaxID=158019 RepID=A0A812BMB9_ACAPH|nr:unnamed protein product [Sepia pharaonis]